MLNIFLISKGDVVYCIRDYVETEFGWVNKIYAQKNRFGKLYLIHLTKGNSYIIENVNKDTIQVKNDFGESCWYNIERFDTIKELRKQKLKFLKNVEKR